MTRYTVIVLAVAGSVASAQTSELYINQYHGHGMVAVQGGGVIGAWNTLHAGENALAVAGTIRTAGNGLSGNTSGAEYTLLGSPVGGPYSIGLPGPWFDGTTDGLCNNYAVQFGNSTVYRFDRTWSSPTPMFSVGFLTSGITYDPWTGTFWVSECLSRTVRNVSPSGAVLGSFVAAANPNAFGIALDPVDGTLWVGGLGSGTICQYDTAGTHLSTVTVQGLGNAFGMECDLWQCYADFDGNGVVDTHDILAFINAWNAGNPAADCDCDGVVNTLDFLCILNRWVAGC